LGSSLKNFLDDECTAFDVRGGFLILFDHCLTLSEEMLETRISFCHTDLRRCCVQWRLGDARKSNDMLRVCDEWHMQVYTCRAISTCEKE